MNDQYNAMTVPTMPERFLFLKCRFCTYMTRFTGNLAKHVRTHTGERPYKCMFCSKRFASKSNYNTHISVHANPSDGLLHCLAPRCRFAVDRSAAFLRHVKQDHADLILDQPEGANEYASDASWPPEMNDRHVDEDIKPELYFEDTTSRRFSNDGMTQSRNGRSFSSGSGSRQAGNSGANNGFRSLESNVVSSDMIGSLLQNNLPLMSVDSILSQAMRNIRPRRRRLSCHSDTNISSTVATNASRMRNSFDGEFQESSIGDGYFNNVPPDLRFNENNMDNDVCIIDDLKPTEDELQEYTASYQSANSGWNNSSDSIHHSSPRNSRNALRKSDVVSRQLSPQLEVRRRQNLHDCNNKRKGVDNTETRNRVSTSNSGFNEEHLCKKESKVSQKISENFSGESEYCQLDDMIDSSGRINTANPSHDEELTKNCSSDSVNNLQRHFNHDSGNGTVENTQSKISRNSSISGATVVMTNNDKSENKTATSARNEKEKANHLNYNNLAQSGASWKCKEAENNSNPSVEERVDNSTVSQVIGTVECTNKECVMELSSHKVPENGNLPDSYSSASIGEKLSVKQSVGCTIIRTNSDELSIEHVDTSVESRDANEPKVRENPSVGSVAKRSSSKIEVNDPHPGKRAKLGDNSEIESIIDITETVASLEECSSDQDMAKITKCDSELNVDKNSEDPSRNSSSVMQNSEESLMQNMNSEIESTCHDDLSETSRTVRSSRSESLHPQCSAKTESSKLISQRDTATKDEGAKVLSLNQHSSISSLSSNKCRDVSDKDRIVQESSDSTELVTSNSISSPSINPSNNAVKTSVTMQDNSATSSLCHDGSTNNFYRPSANQDNSLSVSTSLHSNKSKSACYRTSLAATQNNPVTSTGIQHSCRKSAENISLDRRANASPDCEIIQDNSQGIVGGERCAHCKERMQDVSITGEQQQHEDPVDKLVREGRLFRCASCNILTPDYAVFVLHIGCHGTGAEFSCHYCGASFEERFGFLAHFMRCPHEWSS